MEQVECEASPQVSSPASPAEGQGLWARLGKGEWEEEELQGPQAGPGQRLL